jgi:hypothetical protein
LGDTKEIKQMLEYEPKQKSALDESRDRSGSRRGYKSMSKSLNFDSIHDKQNSRIQSKRNRNRTKIDKKSKVHDSDIGMSFDIEQ